MAKTLRRVADIDTTLYIYYSSYDLGAKEIRMLFGENIAPSTVCRLKNRAREETARQIVETAKKFLPKQKTGLRPNLRLRRGGLILTIWKSAEQN